MSVNFISKVMKESASAQVEAFVKDLSWKVYFSPPKNKNEYTFRGVVNLTKIVLDCLKDNKVGFVVMREDLTIYGFLRSARCCLSLLNDSLIERSKGFELWDTGTGSFVIKEIQKAEIPRAIKELKAAQKMWAELPEKLSKEIRKDNRKKDKAGIKRETVKVKVF